MMRIPKASLLRWYTTDGDGMGDGDECLYWEGDRSLEGKTITLYNIYDHDAGTSVWRNYEVRLTSADLRYQPEHGKYNIKEVGKRMTTGDSDGDHALDTYEIVGWRWRVDKGDGLAYHEVYHDGLERDDFKLTDPTDDNTDAPVDDVVDGKDIDPVGNAVVKVSLRSFETLRKATDAPLDTRLCDPEFTFTVYDNNGDVVKDKDGNDQEKVLGPYNDVETKTFGERDLVELDIPDSIDQLYGRYGVLITISARDIDDAQDSSYTTESGLGIDLTKDWSELNRAVKTFLNNHGITEDNWEDFKNTANNGADPDVLDIDGVSNGEGSAAENYFTFMVDLAGGVVMSEKDAFDQLKVATDNPGAVAFGDDVVADGWNSCGNDKLEPPYSEKEGPTENPQKNIPYDVHLDFIVELI